MKEIMTPRIARTQLATYTYFHVCAKGNNNQNIFRDGCDRIRYLSVVEKYRTFFKLHCFSYCLMANHIHFLFLSPSVYVLSKAMHSIQLAYVIYFNRRYKQTGHLFQSRFTSWVITGEEHLLSTKDYIETNPVKA